MAETKVAPVATADANGPGGGFDFNDPQTLRLIELAKVANEADAALSIRDALRKYKKAVFWALFLSLSLIMEGFDLAIITAFLGLKEFKDQFGTVRDAKGALAISAPWQSGLTNSAQVGQVFGLILNGFCQDRFGCRRTMMFFMVWMTLAIFIPFFSRTPEVLAAGEAICGIPWGVFQTLSTTYASEVVPTVLRPYVTAWVCMCWGLGNVIASVVVRATSTMGNQWAWRLPYGLQWVWPPFLFLGVYFAPESPWNSVRRGRYDEARKSLAALRQREGTTEVDIEATVAYIDHTTKLERAETAGANFIECFKGTNLRRTEINCVVWMAQILCGNALLNYAVVFLQGAGWSQDQTFNINIALRACYVIGGILSWILMVKVGRADLYMGGLAFMFVCLIAIGGLGFSSSSSASLAVGILLVIQTLCNMTTVGPVCYPIVAETPSGKLRYRTIVIGRTVYQFTQIFNNSITPRMVNQTAWGWGAKSAFFYAGTNLACLIWCWFRLPETRNRSFGEIDVLFENRIPARKFKHTKVDQFQHGNGDKTNDEKADIAHVEV